MSTPSEQWEFFRTSIRNQPASILVDLALYQRAPERDKSWRLRAMVQIVSPKNGLSTPEETPTLDQIEDALVAAIRTATGATFAGRVMFGGMLDLVFYAPSDAGFEQAVRATKQQFPAYVFQCASHDDPDWEMFFDILYPDRFNLHQILNRRVLNSLHKSGDYLIHARRLDHTFCFPSNDQRRDFLKSIRARQFEVQLPLRHSPNAKKPFSVTVYRTDSVEAAHVDELAFQLVKLADEFQGSYEGWGSRVVH